MCWTQIEKDFHRHNRRYIYNIQDHIWMRNRRDRIAQFFSHIFRRRTYEFVIVNLVDTIKQILKKKDSWTLRMNSVLNLSVFKLAQTQIVYDTSIIEAKLLYLLSASSESDWQNDANEKYLLECDWDLTYLWWHKDCLKVISDEVEVRIQHCRVTELQNTRKTSSMLLLVLISAYDEWNISFSKTLCYLLSRTYDAWRAELCQKHLQRLLSDLIERWVVE